MDVDFTNKTVDMYGLSPQSANDIMEVYNALVDSIGSHWTRFHLSHNALYRIDPRLSGNRMVDSDLKKYSSTNAFSTTATTEKGYITVASEKGDIRMFDKLGLRVKTPLPRDEWSAQNGYGYGIFVLLAVLRSRSRAASVQVQSRAWRQSFRLLSNPTTGVSSTESIIPGVREDQPIESMESWITWSRIGKVSDSSAQAHPKPFWRAAIKTGRGCLNTTNVKHNQCSRMF